MIHMLAYKFSHNVDNSYDPTQLLIVHVYAVWHTLVIDSSALIDISVAMDRVVH